MRVNRASVAIGGRAVSAIDRGLLVLLGVEVDDEPADGDYLVSKIAGLRIFPDDDDKMNRDIAEAGGEILIVSQFTLLGDCRKGKRPSFIRAARPTAGLESFERCCQGLRQLGLTVRTGEFGADMQVESINDGPVTLLLDSRRVF